MQVTLAAGHGTMPSEAREVLDYSRAQIIQCEHKKEVVCALASVQGPWKVNPIRLHSFFSFFFFSFHRRNKQSFVLNIRLPSFEGRFIIQDKFMSSFHFLSQLFKAVFLLYDAVSLGSACVLKSPQKRCHSSFSLKIFNKK